MYMKKGLWLLVGVAVLFAACGDNKDMKIGLEQLKKNDYEFSSLRFANLAKDKPGFIEARYYAAVSLLLKGDYKGALEQAEKMKELSAKKKKMKYEVTVEQLQAMYLIVNAKNEMWDKLKEKHLELVPQLEQFARDDRDIIATGAADILGHWRFKWKFETQGRVKSQPLLVDKNMYVTSDDGNLYCVHAEDGVFAWSKDFGYPFYNSAPFIAQDKYYIINHDTMAQVDVAQEGKVVTRFPDVSTQPCIAGDAMYATYSPSILKPEDKPFYEIKCVDLKSKRVRWKKKFDDEFCFFTPLVAEKNLYVQASNKFMALDIQSGSPRWSFDIYSRSYPFHALLVDGGVVFGSDVYFYRLQAQNGQLAWKCQAAAEFESSPLYENGSYYIGCNDSHLYAYTAAGKLQWKYKTIGRIVSSPQAGASTVYFGSEDGNVYAVDKATGKIKWKYLTTKGCVAPPLVAGGMVYIGSGDNNLYAFSEELK
jgi:outer membrane protein assembly factor BamB